jgi:hypothetical protein
MSDNVDASFECEPMEAVTVVADDIVLPSTSSTGSGIPHAFFRFQTSRDNQVTQIASTSKSTSSHPRKVVKSTRLPLEMLQQPLALPPALREKGLTRTQLLFSERTTIHPDALHIRNGNEFFLFMDMRIEFQWTSFGMTAAKWVPATETYNNRLVATASSRVIPKNPRALKDKLAEVEAQIGDRNYRKDFTCT